MSILAAGTPLRTEPSTSIPGSLGVAAVYARVSTEDQAENYSLPTQIDACLGHARGLGYSAPESLCFRESASGAKLERPQLSSVLSLARHGSISAVIVYSLDRLARGGLILSHCMWVLATAGVRLISVMDPVEDSEIGHFIAHVHGLSAGLERERIRERTLRGKRRKLESGKLIRAGKLYGYNLNEEGRREIVELEAEVVRRIFSEASSGKSMRSIGRLLHELGIPSPSGNEHWGRSTIARILHNEAYIGITKGWKYMRKGAGVVIRPEEAQIQLPSGTTPAIVDEATWDVVQKQLERNRASATRRMNWKEKYLLRGHVVCGHCGYPLWGDSGKRAGERHFAYRCRGQAAHQYSSCRRGHGLPWIVASKLDSWVWDRIMEVLSDRSLIDREAAKRRGMQSEHSEDDLSKAALRDLRKQEGNLLAAIRQTESSRIQSALMRDLESISERIEKHEQELQRVAQEQAIKDASVVRLDELRDLYGGVEKRLKCLTYDEKRLALTALDARVEVFTKDNEPRATLHLSIPTDKGCLPIQFQMTGE